VELPRSLGLGSAVAVLVGSTIGSGIFRVPSSVAVDAGTLGGVAVVWLAGAVVALFGALTLAELAAAFPRSGGIYVFVREAFGPLPAFLFGWTQLLIIRPSAYGAIALIFAAYAATFLHLTGAGVRVLAAVLIAVLGLANIRSVRWGAAIENATTLAKVAALLVVAVLALLFAEGGGALPGPLGLSGLDIGGLGVAMIAVLWAYDGWADLTFMAGEIRAPERNLPRALIAGTAIVVAVYVLMNLAYLRVLPLSDVAASELVAADTATRIFGPPGAAAIAGLVVLSTFGSLNGAMMTGPRIFYAMAADGLFFRPIAAVHPRYRTPWAAIGFSAALGILYVSVRPFERLAGDFVLGIWPFYALAVAAVFRLRHSRPALPRPYRARGYPWIPGVFLAASVALLANALVRQTATTALDFGIILAGIPVFIAWRRLSRGRGAKRGGK
jgi:amino acid transporter